MNVLLAQFDGIDGFLPGSRASIMLDVVFLAMFAVVPILAISIYLVKYQQRYALHKTIQLWLGAILLVAVTLFEIDMRINGWKIRAEDSPYFAGDGGSLGGVYLALYVHLFFAVPTTILWIMVIVRALRNFASPPVPCAHSPSHIRWAKLAAFEMYMTAVTGWIFYWFAFVA